MERGCLAACSPTAQLCMGSFPCPSPMHNSSTQQGISQDVEHRCCLHTQAPAWHRARAPSACTPRPSPHCSSLPQPSSGLHLCSDQPSLPANPPGTCRHARSGCSPGAGGQWQLSTLTRLGWTWPKALSRACKAQDIPWHCGPHATRSEEWSCARTHPTLHGSALCVTA